MNSPNMQLTPEAYKELEAMERATQDGAANVDHILQERGSRYGKFSGHASVTQDLKDVIKIALAARSKELMPNQKEALDMICHKIGRIINGDPNYADSWIDIAGYSSLVAKQLNGEDI